jgi:hypothetical protein
MTKPKELIIDPEFKDLIPPLTAEEYAGLKRNIKEHGFRTEYGFILIWNEIIIDGYNRHQICLELETEYLDENPNKTPKLYLDLDAHTREMSHLKTRRDVLLWMLRNQLGRRNLTGAARINIALKMEILLKEEAKSNLVTSTGGNEARPLLNLTKAGKRTFNTRKEIALIAGSSEATVRKVKQIKEKAAPELIQEVMLGKKSIHAGFMEMKTNELAKTDPGNTTAPDTKSPAPAPDDVEITYIHDDIVFDSLKGYLESFPAQMMDLLDTIKSTPLSKAGTEKCKGLVRPVKELLDEFLVVLGDGY